MAAIFIAIVCLQEWWMDGRKVGSLICGGGCPRGGWVKSIAAIGGPDWSSGVASDRSDLWHLHSEGATEANHGSGGLMWMRSRTTGCRESDVVCAFGRIKSLWASSGESQVRKRGVYSRLSVWRKEEGSVAWESERERGYTHESRERSKDRQHWGEGKTSLSHTYSIASHSLR